MIHFLYIAYDITYINRSDMDAKIAKFNSVYDAIHQNLDRKTRKTQVKFYISNCCYVVQIRKNAKD